MNKIFIFILVLAISIPLVGVSAQNKQGVNSLDTANGNPELQQVNQGNGQGDQTQNEVQEQTQNQGDVQGQIQNQQATKEQAGNSDIEQGSNRRSRVANAVQEMLMVGERNGGVGEQVRTIAQNQSNIQEEVEGALERVQKRSSFVRFLIGPKYEELNSIESQIEKHIQNIEELKQLKISLYTLQDQNIIEEQISIMEQAREELEGEAKQSSRGFSLFGWLAKRFAK